MRRSSRLQANRKDEVARLLQSVEYAIFRDMQRMGQAYTLLTNAENAAAAKEALREFKAAASDCEKRVRHELYVHGCPVDLVLNINKFAEQNWTWDAFSGLWVNSAHYLQRFIHSKTDDGKIKELTSFYHLMKDLSECSLEIKAESYRRELTE